MKLKVCGMKLNTAEVAQVRPDYLGFIFWKESPRFFDGEIPPLPKSMKKIGVFVDASPNEILEKIQQYDLQGVQLHGDESPEFCREIRNKVSLSLETTIKIIKVFSIKDNFNFNILKPYEPVCDYFLFDTKGELPGGNGYAFDWKVLENYPSTKPFFLSGGIGLEEVESIKEFTSRPEAKYCNAIDVNSRFEMEPGLKKTNTLRKFKELLNL
ncbi:MAG TPA: phosphoribosylanthranilate isomerase [Pricia sp.]|nr:phosphoribosylanthranilate isomerase [Pricia sp.]